MAKKTKRVEKWRAAAAEGGTPVRRTGAASGARGTGGRGPSGMSRRPAPRRSRFPLGWLLGAIAILIVAVAAIVYAVNQNDDDSGDLAAADQTATVVAALPSAAASGPAAADPFAQPIPTTVGVALANDGDVASGCWTEAQRTTDGRQPLQWSAAPATVIDPTQIYTAQLQTNYGPMTWQLLPGASLDAVNSFVCLSRAGYYNGAPFHRIVDEGIFVIQGGDPTGAGSGGPGYTVADSPVVGTYGVGIVSMANTGAANSSGSQFFINTGDNTANFSPTYLNFARVIAGQDTIDAIVAVPRQDNGRGEISSPTEPVVLESVTIYQGGLPTDLGAVIAATPGAGTPASGTPTQATPMTGSLEAGTPIVGTPVTGTPVTEPLAVVTPAATTLDIGSPEAGTPIAATPVVAAPGGATPVALEPTPVTEVLPGTPIATPAA